MIRKIELVAVLMAVATSAQAAKFEKKDTAIEATQTQATKPQQHARDKKDKPTLTIEDVFAGVGEQVKSVTDDQIKVLQRLIQTTAMEDPEKPDLLFRLAELFAEQQRYYNFRSRELDQQIFDRLGEHKNDEANRLKAKQADYQKKEQSWLLAAVKVYVEVADHADKYPNYKRMDEVLFSLAYLLTQVKKEEAARKYFKQLILNFPKSKFVPDAFLSFGEYYFQTKDMESALKFYERVLQYPNSRVYGYAKYMTGWVYYNMNDFKTSLKVFKEVIDLSKTCQGLGNKANCIAMAKEAKKDSVRSYARVGTPEQAWHYFELIGGDYAMTMLEQLGELYNAQGQFPDSIKVYRQLISLAPTSVKICDWENEVVRNVLSMTGSRDTEETIKELERLGAVYDKLKANPAVKKSTVDECHDYAENTVHELATVWHKQAQKTMNIDTYKRTQYLYKEYLSKFGGEKDGYTMTFYYAELLFTIGDRGKSGDTQKFCEAAPMYTKVVELNPSPQAKYLREAALASVISWEKCLAVDDEAAPPEPKKGEEHVARPIPEKWKKLLGAFDVYVKYVPDAPQLVNIKYRRARVYYEYNHMEEAAPLFKDVAYNFQDSELAVYSANLYLDCLNIIQKYKDLRATVDEMLAMPKLIKDEPFKKQLVGLRVGSIRKEIEQLEKAKQSKQAADLYLQLADEYPIDPRHDETLFNAAVLYQKANLIGKAIQTYQRLIKEHEASKLSKRAVYRLGQSYQQVAAFELAADNYESFAAKYPGEREAKIALYTAIVFRRGLGDFDKATKDTKKFTELFGAIKEFSDRAAGVAFGEHLIYEQQKDWVKTAANLKTYLQFWASKGGVDRQIIAQVKLGEIAWRQSCPVAGVNGACITVERVRSSGATKVAEGKKGKGKRKHTIVRTQCGPETKSKITVATRVPKLVVEAKAHFGEAIKLFKNGAALTKVPGSDEVERKARTIDLAFYASEARMMEGDLEYEKLLGMKIPDKLDFSAAPPGSGAGKEKAAKKRQEESAKKFKAWLDAKTKQLETAQKIYQSVILMKQAHWAIAAAARIGQLFQDFSNQLYTAPVPKAGAAPQGFPQAEFDQLFYDSYCDQMSDTAGGLEAKAIEGLKICLDKSSDLSWYNDWSQLCEGELNQIQPKDYPLASELRAQPGYMTISTDSAPVQSTESE